MKIKKTPTGRIMVQATLGTLQVGETWKIDPSLFSLKYLRVAASQYGSAVNKSFTVNMPDPLAKNDKIRITRTR